MASTSLNADRVNLATENRGLGARSDAGKQDGHGQVEATHCIELRLPGIAELICRTTSVLVTLSLAHRLESSDMGGSEFAFNVGLLACALCCATAATTS
jgi:hypothetical protein